MGRVYVCTVYGDGGFRVKFVVPATEKMTPEQARKMILDYVASAGIPEYESNISLLDFQCDGCGDECTDCTDTEDCENFPDCVREKGCPVCNVDKYINSEGTGFIDVNIDLKIPPYSGNKIGITKKIADLVMNPECCEMILR